MTVADKVKKSLSLWRKPKQIDLEDYLKKTRERGLNDEGRFIPSNVPMAPPIGYQKQPSMVEVVRNMVRSEKLAEEARRAGVETFEESEDFDVGDDGEDLRSGFENDFDPPIEEVKAEVEAARTPPAPPPVNPAEPVAEAPKKPQERSEPAKAGS